MGLVVGLVTACAEDPDKLKIAITSPDGDQAIGVGSAVEFKATVKGGEAPVKVVWVFDSTGVGGADLDTSTDKSPGSVTFSTVGEYVITLAAEDDSLQEATDSVTVTASYETFVTDFVATSGNEQVTLTWSAPSHPDYTNYTVRRSTGSAPEEVTDGDPVEPVIPVGSPLVDESVDNDTEYFYTIFASNEDDEYGEGVSTEVTPADKTAPSSVTGVALVLNSELEVNVSWTNPSGGDDDEDFAGVVVRFSDSGYPANAEDGSAGCDIPWDDDAPVNDCDVTVTEYETDYYFSVFAYDDATDKNYSVRATDTIESGEDPTP